MSYKIQEALHILHIKINEEFKLNGLRYKVTSDGEVYFWDLTNWKVSDSVQFADLFYRFADKIEIENYETRIKDLGLNITDVFEWGGFFLKVGSNELQEFDSTKEEWKTETWVTLDKLEKESPNIIKFPYHPKDGDVVHFLDGSMEDAIVNTNYYNGNLILRLLDKKNLLFSTQAGAMWSKRIYKCILEKSE